MLTAEPIWFNNFGFIWIFFFKLIKFTDLLCFLGLKHKISNQKASGRRQKGKMLVWIEKGLTILNITNGISTLGNDMINLIRNFFGIGRGGSESRQFVDNDESS